MTGGFAFDSEVTVTRVVSTLEYGTIFVGETPVGEKVRVRYLGRREMPVVGDTFTIKGQWATFTDKYRRVHHQVETKVMKRRAVLGDLLAPFLQRIPNVGPQRAERLMRRYGHDLIEVLDDPARMAEVAEVLEPGKPALAARIAAQLFSSMAEKSAADQIKLAEADFLVMLEKVGLREPRVANQLWRFCAGIDAIERLLRNPYLAAHLTSWKVADRVGKLLLRKDHPDADLDNHPARFMGALASVWRELLANGDSAVTEAALREMLAKRGVDADLALRHAEGIGNLRRSGKLVRAPGAAWIEDEVARMLRIIEATPASLAIPDEQRLDQLIRDAEMACELRLTVEQAGALRRLICLPLGVLQGGAGVGKTTVMKVLAYIWERQRGNVVFGALAGKAALQLSRGASTHDAPRLAHTLARLIGMLEQQAAYEENPQNGRRPDVEFNSRTLLVIDEAGMMDTPTFYQLLKLLPKGVRILLAGDDGQLFPVAFGKIFHDLVAEGSRVATLTKVLRQAEDSAIPLVAWQVRSGHAPVLPAWNGEAKGVFLIDSQRLARLARTDDFMLIAARRQTVDEWNHSEAMKRRNDATPTRRLGPLATVAVGDPIIITQNRYRHGLFNGLLGTVIDIAGERVQIHFDGENSPRDLPEEAEADVDLAYAITCHKAQGSAAATVVLMADDGALVTREWLYTGITRGRELILLNVEDQGRLVEAVARRTERTTGFAF
ncbi:ATP-dependent RecD-like DNA helicase [Dechloromonas sp. ARDL1]|uniref:ATP-dependent DNA helicase n=1 Tax=Dechloromonas sp. ARDL1 TaxID=3322121 RepID=UPI003DA73A88